MLAIGLVTLARRSASTVTRCSGISPIDPAPPNARVPCLLQCAQLPCAPLHGCRRMLTDIKMRRWPRPALAAC
jgi:hypothetical protein